ncbi:MAG: TrmO family methyltransferase [Gammaproteobacteria bacterium]|nr:TrmO family methyltransferase [Gammaproteobacteria bacterium]
MVNGRILGRDRLIGLVPRRLYLDDGRRDMHPEQSFHWRPLGRILTDVPNDEVARRRREMISTIEMFPPYDQGLVGIGDYSHLFVLFGLDRATPAPDLRVNLRHDPQRPPVGVFAARGRNHPNGIGLAVVELLAVDGARLTVRRLDAWHGSPVLDLKPYDDYDVVEAPRVPAWWRARAAGRG